MQVYIQVRHAIQCRKCLETIVSNHIHDFKMCSCVGIDGGILDGNRTLGNLRDMENRSMYCASSEQENMVNTTSIGRTQSHQ